MSSPMYQWRSHTGEIELAIEADTPEQVFVEAATALAELIALERESGEEERLISLDAPDLATLLDDTLYEIPAEARADMRVPARVFADEELLAAIRTDRSLEQLQNVATLPGIVDAAIAMPDIQQGYGFPVG